ncbi:MAG: DUF1818 family protein [Synechococcales cyanobacterium CRU_2_2]|nr:DUF1818 family protein [Synechococcales cyanobacterium CRU_2_2]
MDQNRQLQEGAGWRLGWNPGVVTYQGLVGGANWSIELTAAELDNFCRLLIQLADTMATMAAELMDEERLCCETESDRLWLEAEGFPQDYGLRMILSQGRGAEGAWAAAAVPGLLGAVRSLPAEMHGFL